MTRLFVAIDPPESVKDLLEPLCHGLPGARWVHERQFHLTLRFLGEVEGPAIDVVHDVLRAVRAAPFELRLAGTGHFPPRGRPRVLWAGLRAEPRLVELQKRVEKALLRAGQPREERRFFAHVTLARLVDAPLARVVDFLRATAGLGSAPFPVERFHLYSSVLGRAGSRHTVQESYPLLGSGVVDPDLPPPARLS